jgi:hypothetical protein
MKPAEFRRKMAIIAHPQATQRFESEYGKPIVPDNALSDAPPPVSGEMLQQAPADNRDRRVVTPKARGYSVVGLAGGGGGGGGGSVRYVLYLMVDTDHDALATATLSPSGIEFEAGSIVVATAIPSSGYHFVQWDLSWGSLSSTDNPLSVTMDSNKTITARIEAD